MVTYSYLVTNTGNVTLDPGVSPTRCPASRPSPARHRRSSRGSETCTATYTTTQADVDAGAINNTGTATGTPLDAVPSVTRHLLGDHPGRPDPAITLVKSASITSFAAAGTPITYSYLVTNTGNVTLNPVVGDRPDAGSVGHHLPGDHRWRRRPARPARPPTPPPRPTSTPASITNTGTATGTPPSGPDVIATVTVTVPAVRRRYHAHQVGQHRQLRGRRHADHLQLPGHQHRQRDPEPGRRHRPDAGPVGHHLPGHLAWRRRPPRPARPPTPPPRPTSTPVTSTTPALATGTPPSGPTVTGTSPVTIPAVQTPSIGAGQVGRRRPLRRRRHPGHLQLPVTNTGNVTLDRRGRDRPDGRAVGGHLPGRPRWRPASRDLHGHLHHHPGRPRRGRHRQHRHSHGHPAEWAQRDRTDTQSTVPAVQTPAIAL